MSSTSTPETTPTTPDPPAPEADSDDPPAEELSADATPEAANDNDALLADQPAITEPADDNPAPFDETGTE